MSDKHISSHAYVGMCVTVCMTVHVFLSAANCVPGVNGASDDIGWGGCMLSGRVSIFRRGTDAVTGLQGVYIQSLIISDSKFI